MSADFALNTAKFQLELLLKQFNLRIFQSMNKWYIVEGTNMFDYYVKDLIFNELDLHRIEAACLSSNKPSLSLLKKNGFQYEGTARKLIKINPMLKNKAINRKIRNPKYFKPFPSNSTFVLI